MSYRVAVQLTLKGRCETSDCETERRQKTDCAKNREREAGKVRKTTYHRAKEPTTQLFSQKVQPVATHKGFRTFVYGCRESE